ncbi:MAG: PAS domain S-box protein, partial [Methanoregula sp.]|nr:PAS domain S-box protein [Methanoregula sp.]
MVLNREITAQIKSVLKENPQGLSITDIVAAVDINRNTAGRYLENLLVSGQVEMRQLGMAKIYTLSQRVPVSAVLSISSELIMQLDKNLRIIFANEPFLSFLSVSSTDLFGKNIEYSRVLPVFEEIYNEFVDRIRSGIAGTEWSGELTLKERGIIFSCRIAPTVFDDGKKGVSVILNDVSGKKRADEALKASEDRFRRIFEDGPLGMAIADPDYRFTNVNRKLCGLLGYAQDELLSKTLIDITHPVHASRDLVQIKKLYAGEIATYRTDKQYIKKDGSIFWGAVTVSPLKDEHGNVVSTIALIEDISRRKIVEEKLRESEEKYRHVFDWANEAIMLHPLTTSQQSGRFIEVNAAACRMLGYSREELLSMGPADTLPVELRSLTGNLIRQAETKDTFLFETRFQRKDGTTFPVESNARLVTFGGRLVWLSLVRDITERKHAEDALRESETRYRSLANASQDLIFVICKDDIVEYVNSVAAHLIGKQPERIVGSKRSALFPPPVSDRQKSQLAQVFSTGNPSRSEGPMVIHNETRWFDHFLVPVRDKDGSVQSVLGISRDITNQKQVEDALRESEEKYRTLVERANDGICIVQDKIIKFCNPAIAAFWGGSEREILGRKFSDFVHPDVLFEVTKHHTMRMSGETIPSTYETILQRKDGSRFFAEVNSGICPFEGRPANHVVVRDINDRKQAEEALKKSEERFRDLINTTADIVWQTDAEKRFVYVSPQVEKILGYTPNELVGRSPFEF